MAKQKEKKPEQELDLSNLKNIKIEENKKKIREIVEEEEEESQEEGKEREEGEEGDETQQEKFFQDNEFSDFSLSKINLSPVLQSSPVQAANENLEEQMSDVQTPKKEPSTIQVYNAPDYGNTYEKVVFDMEERRPMITDRERDITGMRFIERQPLISMQERSIDLADWRRTMDMGGMGSQSPRDEERNYYIVKEKKDREKKEKLPFEQK